MIFLLPIPVDSKSDAIGRKSFSTTISFSSRKTRIERGCRANVRLCLMAFSTNNCRQTGGICPSICLQSLQRLYFSPNTATRPGVREAFKESCYSMPVIIRFFRRRPGGAEEGNHTGERHGTESVRRAGVHLHTARIFHCQHQQPPMPAGHRGKQTVPALIHHFTGLQDTRQLRGSIRAGACPAKAGVPILVRRRRDRRAEPPQRTAPNEGSGGGKPARILPEAGARRDLREMDARSHHTQ